jgi:short subunit dehydrogenase-like uncharacterized protein
VDACVRFGTDYVDITGEYHWVRRMIDSYDNQAQASKCLIVSFCGFDSIPSDLGAFMLANHALTKYNRPVQSLHATMYEAKGGFSGGTLYSGRLMSELPKKELQEMQDTHYLCPTDDQRQRPARAIPSMFDQLKNIIPYYDKIFGRWQTVFVMERINARVVRRSSSLLPKLYSPHFQYVETQSAPNVIVAALISFFVPLFYWMMRSKAASNLLARVSPKPGEGPSEKVMREGHFQVQSYATLKMEDDRTIRLRGRVMGHGDPGYSETAKMVSEAALCLAVARKGLPSVSSGRFGFLTPSAAFGTVLIERLRRAGQVWEVTEA